jgi:Flp pilus assembly pilin Flp
MRQAVAVLETTWHTLRYRARAEHGQDLVEYGLLAALISIFLIGVVTTLGQTINNSFWEFIVQGFPGA